MYCMYARTYLHMLHNMHTYRTECVHSGNVDVNGFCVCVCVEDIHLLLRTHPSSSPLSLILSPAPAVHTFTSPPRSPLTRVRTHGSHAIEVIVLDWAPSIDYIHTHIHTCIYTYVHTWKRQHRQALVLEVHTIRGY